MTPKTLRQELERVRKALVKAYGFVHGNEIFDKIVDEMEIDEH